jgi:hypothetical protein
MTELLIIKAGDDYFRFKEESFEPCAMNKASVFPLTQLKEAKMLCRRLRDAGTVGVALRKLTIIEEPYIDNPE